MIVAIKNNKGVVMTMLNYRCKAIILFLVNIDYKVTISELAKQFKVSARTIRYDLDLVKEWLSDKGIILVKKSRVGVWIEDRDDANEKLKNMDLGDVSYHAYIYTPQERKKIILNLLFKHNEHITTQDIAKKLEVSRSTVFKDLDEVEKWLSVRKIRIEKTPKKGIKIKATEECFRKGFQDYIKESFDKNKILDFLRENSPKVSKNRAETILDDHMKRVFKEMNTQDVEDIIAAVESKLKLKFADTAFASLFVHIAIAIERLKKKEKIQMPSEQLNNLRVTNEFKMTREILREIEHRYEIVIPDAEIGYITIHILGAKLRDQLVNDNIESTSDDNLESTINIFLNNVSYKLGYDLSNEKELIRGLLIHLRPAIERLRYALINKNPLFKEIVGSYKTIYDICKDEVIVFESQYGIEFNEDEISYIAMHVASAVERKKEPKNIDDINLMVVCGSGIGTANMLCSRLNKEFTNINILGKYSVFELNKQVFDNVDYIISSVQLRDQLPVPVVYVNPLLIDKDLFKLKRIFNANKSKAENSRINELMNIIHQNCKIKNEARLIKQLNNFFGVMQKSNYQKIRKGLLNYISMENVICGINAETFEDALRITAKPLVNKNKITTRYIDRIINMNEDVVEHLFLKEYFIMPHTDAKEDVLDTCMSLGILDKCVVFNKRRVKYILLIGAVDNYSHTGALEDLIELLENEDFLSEISKCLNSESVIASIKRMLIIGE